MNAIKKHHKLLSEHPDHYMIVDTRDNKSFPIAKRHLSLAMHKKLSSIQKFDEGGQTKSPSDQPDQGPITVNVNPDAQPVPAVVAPPVQNVSGVAPIASPVSQGPLLNVPRPISPNASASKGALAAEQLGERGDVAAAQAQAEENAQNVSTYEEGLKNQKALMAEVQAKHAAQIKNLQTISDGVASATIDPNRYYNNLNTGGKIGTILGVILGGLGAGLQHSSVNQAQQVLDNTIRNDIESQKAELGKKQTLYSMALDRYKDENAADADTYQKMNALVDGQIKLNAARSGNPKAQAAADQLISQRRTEYFKGAPSLMNLDQSNMEWKRLFGASPTVIPGSGPNIMPPAGSGTTSQGINRQPQGVMGSGKYGSSTESSADRQPQEEETLGPNENFVSTGPSASDIAFENRIKNGLPTKVSSFRNGYGVNLPLSLYQEKIGVMKPPQADEANKEAGDYKLLQNQLNMADSMFNEASRHADLRGRWARNIDSNAAAAIGGGAGALLGGVSGSVIPGAGTVAGAGVGAIGGAAVGKGLAEAVKSGLSWFDEDQKRYSSAVRPLVALLTHEEASRVNPETIKQFQPLFPEYGDSPETLAAKRQELRSLLLQGHSFPTLQQFKLVNQNDPLIQGTSKGNK